MAKKTSSTTKTKTEGKNIEREYVIPLREGFRQKPIYKKTPAAVKTIKIFLVRHMKIRDRDLRRIRINKYLNEYLWFRGIKRPPTKVKVRAVKEEAGTENEKVRVYLSELPEKLHFKQKREDKLLKAAETEKEKASAKTSAKTAAKESAKTAKEATDEKAETKQEIVEDIKHGGGGEVVSEEVAKKEEQLDEKETKEAEEIEKKEKELDKEESEKAEKKSSKKTSSKKSSKTSK